MEKILGATRHAAADKIRLFVEQRDFPEIDLAHLR